MPTGIEAKELTIQHMRKPCQRVPKEAAAVREGPYYAVESQTCPDILVVGNINLVIEINKRKISDLLEADNDCDSQQNAEAGKLIFFYGLIHFFILKVWFLGSKLDISEKSAILLAACKSLFTKRSIYLTKIVLSGR
jgi:hypothetical protein